PILQTVRSAEDEGEGHLFDRLALLVPDEGRELDRFAGPVNPPLAVEKKVDWTGTGPPFHAPIAQVEARTRQVEEGEILAFLGLGLDMAGGKPALAPDQAGREVEVALGPAGSLPQDLVVARNEGDGDPGPRAGGRKRAGEDVKPVFSHQGRKADIGDDEPLGGLGLPGLGAGLPRARSKDVDAGPAIRQRLLDRDRGDHLAVELNAYRKRAFPQLLPHLFGDGLGVEVAKLVEEAVVAKAGGKVPCADPVELEQHLFSVDGDYRDSLAADPGQDVGVAGEANRGRAVAHVDVQVDLPLQDFVHRGWQAGPQAKAVAATMLDPFEAELLALSRHGGGRGAVEGDVGGKVEAARHQLLGELDADAGARAVGFHRVIEDAKAVFGPQAL